MRASRWLIMWAIMTMGCGSMGCGSKGAFPDGGLGTAEDAPPAANRDATGGEDLIPGFDDASPNDANPTDDAAPDAEPGPDLPPGAELPPGADVPPGMDVLETPDSGVELNCARRAGITPNANMSFFASSVGTGARGGNLGGLAGADARCTCLAATVGITNRTWRAYLSVTTPRVNARDRIGTGPWINFNGATVAANVAALHTNSLDGNLIFTEDGQRVPSIEHDMLTGTNPDGTPHEPYDCGGWEDGTNTGFAWVGHPDWNLPNGSGTWNSAHESFCDPAGLAANDGAGRIYCFAE